VGGSGGGCGPFLFCLVFFSFLLFLVWVVGWGGLGGRWGVRCFVVGLVGKAGEILPFSLRTVGVRLLGIPMAMGAHVHSPPISFETHGDPMPRPWLPFHDGRRASFDRSSANVAGGEQPG